jgi:hypothetical protein
MIYDTTGQLSYSDEREHTPPSYECECCGSPLSAD